MVNQQFFLPMVPDSAPIVINVAQNDYDAEGYAGRLIFNLIANGTAYDMDGATATFEGGKPDGNAFAYDATIVSASVVRVNLKKQMTNVTGRVVCNLVLKNTDGVVGSFNVWLEVQPSAIAGTDPSQTDIPSLVAEAEIAADRAEQAADNAEAWSEHPPYIGLNGNWFTYDIDLDLYTDTGISAYANKWYIGTDVSGKSTTPAAFPTGIAYAAVNDLYLNTNEQGVYHCTVAGDEDDALWVYDFSLSGGGAGSLAALSDVSLTNPQTGQILTYDNGQWINKAPDKSYVRYAGAINFADLATNAATYLDDDYEDAFFLISDGGTIGTGEAAAYWTSNFSDGDVIPADAHIAVINVNRGTANPPSYKYDDFGGFVDISGKADKSELVTFVTAQLPSGQQTYNITNALLKTTSYIVSIMASQQLKYTSANIVSNGTFTITWSSVLSGTVDVAIGIYNP
jgi:hypothetical protein